MSRIISVLILSLSLADAFVSPIASKLPRLGGRWFSETMDMAELGMTPKLAKMVEGLRGLPDDKMRVKQVLFLASQGEPMPEALKVPANKVPGCLSIVHVHAIKQEDGTLTLSGDSDAQITKGLANLLVDGLSGYSAAEIQKVRPEFITFAGLGSSLTPGRNNGFVNMLAVIKRKAMEFDGLSEPEKSSSVVAPPSSVAGDSPVAPATPAAPTDSGGALYDAILAKTRVLKPLRVSLTQRGEELVFDLTVVAACFEGLAEEKRNKMIQTVMRKEIQQVSELSVTALTPTEADP